jgi:hypothetical protein
MDLLNGASLIRAIRQSSGRGAERLCGLARRLPIVAFRLGSLPEGLFS